MKKIEQENEKYINIYNEKMKNKINFLSKMKVNNLHSNKEFAFNQNEEYLIKNDYLYLVYNSIALQKKFENNNEYVAIFLTNTLVSEFHSLKQTKNGNYIRNKKFEHGNTINLGYKILTSFFKSLYKNFKVNNEFQKIEFIRVIEPHMNGTAHLHSIVFLKQKYLNIFERYYKYKVSKDKNLGQYKIEIINDISRSAGYILKYAQKNFSFNNDKFKIYYGWKLQNKIRAYTFTRQFIPRDMFNKLSFYLSKNFALDEDIYDEFATNNYYELVHNFTSFTQNIIDNRSGEISNKLKLSSEDDMFFIQLTKGRNKIENCHNVKIIEIEKAIQTQNIKFINQELSRYNLLNPFNHFVKESTSFNYTKLYSNVYIFLLYEFLNTLRKKVRYIYKINDYKIYKKHHQLARYDLVFDKKDWSISKH